MTMGVVVVAALAARAIRSPKVTITSDLRRISSATMSPNRSYRPSADPAFQDEVLPFHLAEGPQALHERPGARVDRLGSSHLRDWGRGRDDADAVDLTRLPLSRERRGEEAAGQSADERPPLHYSI